MLRYYSTMVNLQQASFTLQMSFNQREFSLGIHMHAKAGMYPASIM